MVSIMRIKDEHLKVLDSVIAPHAFEGFAVSVSDEVMRLCQKLLAESCEPDVLKWISGSLSQCLEAEFEWRTTPMPVSESFLRDTQCFYQTLYAMLAPLQSAQRKRLPRISGQDVQERLQDPAIRNLTIESIIKKYEQRNPAWPAYIRPSFSQLQRVVTRQLIWVITEAFFRKLS